MSEPRPPASRPDPESGGASSGAAPVPEAVSSPGMSASGMEDNPEGEASILEDDPATRSLSEALRYGFGFLKVVMAVLVLFFVVDRFTYVEEGEVLLVRRFGQYLTEPETGALRVFTPGKYHFLWPAPIETAERIRVSAEMEISLDEEFWPRLDARTAARGPDALPMRTRFEPVLDGYMLTGDLNLLHSRWKIKYRIVDYEAYVLAARDPERVLRKSACAAIVRNLAGIDVDQAYYGNRNLLFDRIRQDIQNDLAPAGSFRWGIQLISVVNTKFEAPGAAQGAFDAVTTAQSERTRLIEQARTEADTIRQNASTEAQAIRLDAEHYRTMVVSRAAADAQRLRDLLDRFPDDPEGLDLYLRQYRYLQIREALAKVRLYLLREGQTIFWTRPDAMDFDNGMDQEGTPR